MYAYGEYSLPEGEGQEMNGGYYYFAGGDDYNFSADVIEIYGVELYQSWGIQLG